MIRAAGRSYGPGMKRMSRSLVISAVSVVLMASSATAVVAQGAAGPAGDEGGAWDTGAVR